MGLTAERLRERLKYDPITGVFTWLPAQGKGRRKEGTVAGHRSKDSGYVLLWVDDRLYRAHRLAWLYVTGGWPPRLIDHKDRNRANNCWSNLRLANDKQNSENASLRCDNTSGARGIRFDRNRWVARIYTEGREIYLGRFEQRPEAEKARLAAEKKFFTHSEASSQC